MPDFITVGNNQVPNQAKIVDGIRRFRKGMRNRLGEKDKSQQEHLRYNLHKDADLTWDHALCKDILIKIYLLLLSNAH